MREMSIAECSASARPRRWFRVLTCALDAVHAGRQRLARRCQQRQLGLVRAAAHVFVGVRVQVDERGQRQPLHLAVQLEVGRKLRRHRALQLAPGARAAQVELGRQRLLGVAHQVAALLRGLAQHERVRPRGLVGGDHVVQHGASPPIQAWNRVPNWLSRTPTSSSSEWRRRAGRVAGVGGDEGCEVGVQRAGQLAGPVEAVDRLTDQGRQLGDGRGCAGSGDAGTSAAAGKERLQVGELLRKIRGSRPQIPASRGRGRRW